MRQYTTLCLLLTACGCPLQVGPDYRATYRETADAVSRAADTLGLAFDADRLHAYPVGLEAADQAEADCTAVIGGPGPSFACTWVGDYECCDAIVLPTGTSPRSKLAAHEFTHAILAPRNTHDHGSLFDAVLAETLTQLKD